MKFSNLYVLFICLNIIGIMFLYYAPSKYWKINENFRDFNENKTINFCFGKSLLKIIKTSFVKKYLESHKDVNVFVFCKDAKY